MPKPAANEKADRDSPVATNHSVRLFRFIESPNPVEGYSGFTGLPLRRTSKWRCGPVLSPVLPTYPINWPQATRCPGPITVCEQCPYNVETPPPCRMIIHFPYPPRQPALNTSPAAAAQIS